MKPKNLKIYKYPYKKIFIKWDDSTSRDTWLTIEEAVLWIEEYSNHIIEEAGFLFAEDEHAIYLISKVCPATITDTENVGRIHRIPRNWILKKKVMK